jgi:prepilin-type N-terminal cleavage/methylation domain-containing protein
MNTTRGFTLIELLFVITVLAFFSTTGILFYQRYLQTEKIQKTVSQIDQWLQAGMAYYTQYQQWPQNTQALFTTGYMPENAEKRNPWCNAGECYKVISTPQSQLFSIIATINAPQTIRDAIAARLPYGKPEGSGVVATVNVPLAGINYYPDVIIKSITPYTLAGDASFEFQRFYPDRERDTTYLFRILETPVEAKIPDCELQYNSNYRFVSYATVTEIGSTAQDKQPPVISDFNLITKLQNNKIVLGGFVRPQVYTQYEISGTRIKSEVFKDLGSQLTMKGFVFFLCCKKGVSCA